MYVSSTYLHVYVWVGLSVNQMLHQYQLSVYLSISQNVCIIYLCLSDCWSVCQYVCMYVWLIYLSVCISLSVIFNFKTLLFICQSLFNICLSVSVNIFYLSDSQCHLSVSFGHFAIKSVSLSNYLSNLSVWQSIQLKYVTIMWIHHITWL